jgi:hypothetical protein
MTPDDVRNLVAMIVRDRELTSQLWKAMVRDEKNIAALIEVLDEVKRRQSGGLETSG